MILAKGLSILSSQEPAFSFIDLCNLEKEKQSWRNQAPWLQTILHSYSASMVLAQK